MSCVYQVQHWTLYSSAFWAVESTLDCSGGTVIEMVQGLRLQDGTYPGGGQ